MTVFVIADIKVTDNAWVPAYGASVHDLVHKHGGKYLSRSGNVKTLEGKPLDTSLIAIMAFPSAKAAEAFTNDPQYAPFVAERQKGDVFASTGKEHVGSDHNSGGSLFDGSSQCVFNFVLGAGVDNDYLQP